MQTMYVTQKKLTNFRNKVKMNFDLKALTSQLKGVLPPGVQLRMNSDGTLEVENENDGE